MVSISVEMRKRPVWAVRALGLHGIAIGDEIGQTVKRTADQDDPVFTGKSHAHQMSLRNYVQCAAEVVRRRCPLQQLAWNGR